MYTAAGIIEASPKFRQIATDEAISKVAEVNGTSVDLTVIAYNRGVNNVVDQVNQLVMAAATEFANDLTAAARKERFAAGNMEPPKNI